MEDMLGMCLRRQHPEINRIGIEHGPTGWRCHRVWLRKRAPQWPDAKTEAILAEANKLLDELLQSFEIEDERRAAG